jgi:diguanylate cyclase (GGDEF)-like protein
MKKVFNHSTSDLIRVRLPANFAELLSGFRDDIFANSAVHGCEVNLCNDTGNALVTAHLTLPAEFGGIQKTYLGFQYHLNIPDANSHVFKSGEARLITEQELGAYDETTRMRFERWKMRYLFVLPLMCQRQDGTALVVGTVGIFGQAEAFDQKAMAQFEATADLYAPQMLVHWNCQQAVERRKTADVMYAEMQQFIKYITQMNSLTSLDQVFTSIGNEFIERFHFDMVNILLEENGELPMVHTSFSAPYQYLTEKWEPFRKQTRYSLSVRDGQSALIFQKNQLFHVQDVMKILHLPMAEKDKMGLSLMETPRTFMIVPIRLDTQVIGVMWLASLAKPIDLPPTDLALIELLASFISTAICNAKAHMTIEAQKREIELLNTELQSKLILLDKISKKDRLTELNNFGSFEEEIKRQTSESARAGADRPLSMILLDIDHFKAFNDVHGHPAGNQVLQEVGRRISKAVRDMDFVARYGGEEFVVLLPQCDLANATVIAERIRLKIGSESFVANEESHQVTISGGCTQFQPGETAEQFTSRADHALYTAKHLGRNRIEQHACVSPVKHQN